MPFRYAAVTITIGAKDSNEEYENLVLLTNPVLDTEMPKQADARVLADIKGHLTNTISRESRINTQRVRGLIKNWLESFPELVSA